MIWILVSPPRDAVDPRDVSLTMEFLSYGGPLKLAPPPKTQVANITAQVVQQAKASSG